MCLSIKGKALDKKLVQMLLNIEKNQSSDQFVDSINQNKNINTELQNSKSQDAQRKLSAEQFILNTANFIPNKLGFQNQSKLQEYISAAGMGYLGGSVYNDYSLSKEIDSLLETVDYKLRARELMMKTVKNHNTRLLDLDQKIYNMNEDTKIKQETIVTFFDDLLKNLE